MLLILNQFSALAYADSKTVIIPMFEDDRYIGRFPNPVTPDRRDSSDFTLFNGIAVDRQTDLGWQRQDDGVARTWREAFTYCKNLRLLNRTDWRLPTFHELLSIYSFVPVDFDDLQPTINQSVFPNTAASGDFNGEYWTMTRDLERQSIQRVGSWYFAISFLINTDTEGDRFSFFRYRAIADSQSDSTAQAFTRCVL